MKNSLLMEFTVDKKANTVNVTREFAAELDLVWAAWTKKEILDQWWAPKPWSAKTKHLDLKPGGYWHYAMVSPEGDEHWCRADYASIEELEKINYQDAFCDEDGVINTYFPRAQWQIRFFDANELTKVKVTIAYEQLADLEKIIEMGFKEGFTSGLENLEALLSTLKSNDDEK